MKHPISAALSLLVLVASLAVHPAAADGVRVGGLAVDDPWARATIGQARTGAAYVTVRNQGGPDRLIGAETPVAARAELHIHAMEGGMMKMRPVKAVAIGTGERVSLRPGGLHVMLMGLKTPLEENATFPLTLKFEKAGSVAVTVRVLKPGAMGPGDPHDRRHEGDGRHGPAGDGDRPPAAKRP